MERLPPIPTGINQDRCYLPYVFWKIRPEKVPSSSRTSAGKRIIGRDEYPQTAVYVYDTLIRFLGKFNSVRERYQQNLTRNQGRGGGKTRERKWASHNQQQEEYLPERTGSRTPKLLVTTVMREEITLEAVHQHKNAPMVSPAYKSTRSSPIVSH